MLMAKVLLYVVRKCVLLPHHIGRLADRENSVLLTASEGVDVSRTLKCATPGRIRSAGSGFDPASGSIG
jgi:hypothetical protein